MDVPVLVTRVVAPGPPPVVTSKMVTVPVPAGMTRSDVAAPLQRMVREIGTTVDVLL